MKINHALIICTDLEAMSRFWVDIIGLEIGERPPFPFKGVWLHSEGTPFIHLAEQKNATYGNCSIAHLAFEGADYQALLSRLKQFNYDYVEKDVPLSGDRQVFIQGPDAVTVEMMFPLDSLTKGDNNIQSAYQQGENLSFLGGKTT